MPFGKYKNFEACEKEAKKHGIKNPGAYCAVIEHNITKHWPGEKQFRKDYKKNARVKI